MTYVLRRYPDPRAMEDSLNSLPNSTTEAYDQIIKRMESKGTNDRDVAFRTFALISNAKRDLRISEIQDFLAVRKTDIRLQTRYRMKPQQIIEACESLIVYDESTDAVRFHHKTVKDYIQTRILPSVDLDLTQICLTYLSLEIAIDENFTFRSDKVKWLSEHYPGFIYAAEFWATHVKESGEMKYSPEMINTFKSSEKNDLVAAVDNFWTFGPSVLHILASAGLTATCRQLLEMET